MGEYVTPGGAWDKNKQPADIPLFKVRMNPDAAIKVAEVLMSGQIAQGWGVDFFETQLRSVLGLSRNPITVNSGTSALHLAYHLAGVRRGSIVLVSPMTCAATITPILALGAIPIWADVDPLTGNIDPAAIPRTLEWLRNRIVYHAPGYPKPTPAALVAVDWAGVPADYRGIRRALGEHTTPIIEDAAHAMLAEREGKSIAYYTELDNHYVCYSLQAIKHLTSGDGGILVCPNGDLLDARARRLRWFGLDRTSPVDFRAGQDIDEAGYKFHMNDISAAIGLANLVGLESCVAQHRYNARALRGSLFDLAPYVETVPDNPGASYWVYTLLVDNRASFVEHMKAKGIACSEVHRRNDLHTAFRAVAPEQPPLPGLDAFSSRQISIPCGWWLTAGELDRIIDAVRTWGRAQKGTS